LDINVQWLEEVIKTAVSESIAAYFSQQGKQPVQSKNLYTIQEIAQKLQISKVTIHD
jgi:hypothetical protein